MNTSEQRLWVEKYRPHTIEDAKSIHKETLEMLSKLA
jgi:hypothetical protein